MNELTVFNSDLIPVYTSDTGQKVVIGRELYEALGIKTNYKDWFPRMVEYGFEEGKDFSSFLSASLENNKGRPRIEHYMSLDMAKEICMIQRTDIGKTIRRKLIELDKAVSNPNYSYLIEDPAKRAEVWAMEYRERQALAETNKVQSKQLKELQPKAAYYDVMISSESTMAISVIAADYGKSAIWMNKYLNRRGVQRKQGSAWILYNQYIDKGYAKFDVIAMPDRKNGGFIDCPQLRWTQKGREFIYELLKSDGILPMIEQKEGYVEGIGNPEEVE